MINFLVTENNQEMNKIDNLPDQELQNVDLKIKKLTLENMQLELENKKITVSNKELQAIK
jgi:hypothetical protein